MAIRLGSVVINCSNMEVMTSFWSEALGLIPSSSDPDDDFRVLRGQHVNLSLQLADTPVSARDQMHLDLYTDDQAGEVERLAGIGAMVVRHNRDLEDDYVVMTDPEGNEFCVAAMSQMLAADAIVIAAIPFRSGPRVHRWHAAHVAQGVLLPRSRTSGIARSRRRYGGKR